MNQPTATTANNSNNPYYEYIRQCMDYGAHTMNLCLEFYTHFCKVCEDNFYNFINSYKGGTGKKHVE